jgi:hypothetical protein
LQSTCARRADESATTTRPSRDSLKLECPARPPSRRRLGPARGQAGLGRLAGRLHATRRRPHLSFLYLLTSIAQSSTQPGRTMLPWDHGFRATGLRRLAPAAALSDDAVAPSRVTTSHGRALLSPAGSSGGGLPPSDAAESSDVRRRLRHWLEQDLPACRMMRLDQRLGYQRIPVSCSLSNLEEKNVNQKNTCHDACSSSCQSASTGASRPFSKSSCIGLKQGAGGSGA